MSSHHIVRDSQEPALIVVNTDNLHEWLLKQLLGWSPIVLCEFETAEKLQMLGIKVDVVFTNAEKLDEAKCSFDYQKPIEIVQLKTNLIDDGIQFLESKQKIFHVLISESDFDPVLMQRSNVGFFTEKRRIFGYQGNTFNKWYPKGTYLEFSGLSFELRANNLDRDGKGFRVKKDGIVTLPSQKDIFYVSEFFS